MDYFLNKFSKIKKGKTMNLLYLNIINNTVDAGGKPGSGYSNDEIYLTVQGKINKVYNYLDWETGNFKEMSANDNVVELNYLGLPQDIKYADYFMKLSDIIKLGWVKNGNIQIPVPVEGGRAYISFNKPVYLHVNAGPSPAEPNDDSTSDPNYSTVWDKFEFTVAQTNAANEPVKFTLWSNTTCVDFVGIPMVYNLSKGGKVIDTVGFNIPEANKKDPFTYIAQELKTDDSFKNLVGDFRIYAPKVTSNGFNPNFGEKGNYLKDYIDYCWKLYSDNQTAITLWNYVDITKAENGSLKDDTQGKGVKWTALGKINNNILTFELIELLCSDGTKLQLPGVLDFTIPLPSTYDTFRQGGVFTKDDTLHTETYTQAIDGDIKNQVSTALNRCVMHDKFEGPSDPNVKDSPKSWWADISKFYLQNNLPVDVFKTNNYSKYMHEKSIDNKCYALAYDDKYSQNVNISETIDETETVMNVELYSQKKEPVVYPAWSPKKQDDPNVQVGIDPDNSNNENAAVVWLKSSVSLDYVYLLYKDKNSLQPESYSASQMIKNGERYELKFLPPSVLNPFCFYFKYRETGKQAETLVPSDAIGNKNVYDYKH